MDYFFLDHDCRLEGAYEDSVLIDRQSSNIPGAVESEVKDVLHIQ